MKIMKLLASCAMVGALTAVCASGAFADVAGTVTADYQYTAADETAGTEASAKVVVTVADYAVTGDYTVLVLNKDVDAKATNAGVVENADITQIDQWGNSSATIELALPATLADGTYYVRVGGNADGYIDTTFTVGSTGGDEGGEDVPETVGRYVGDFLFDEDINPEDSNAIQKFNAGMPVYDDGSEPELVDCYASAYAASDSVDSFEELSGEDANAIMWWLAGNTEPDKVGNVAGYGEFYYDAETDMYLLYGDLIFE